jgi:hypothetical protein
MTSADGNRVLDHILDKGSRTARLTLTVPLEAAPFPVSDAVADFFTETDPASGERFRGIAGNRYGEDAHYRESRALLHVPPGFDADFPQRILLYFHGHHTEALHAAGSEQAVAAQLTRSGANAVLIAPQLALRAADSHAGNLTLENRARELIAEACALLSDRLGAAVDESAPVVIASFSGGYRAVANCMLHGGLDGRIAGLVLLDSLYGQLEDFAHWRCADREAFLIALNGHSTRGNAEALAETLRGENIAVADRLPETVRGGETVFIATDTPHTAIPLRGPPPWPIYEILKRLA